VIFFFPKELSFFLPLVAFSSNSAQSLADNLTERIYRNKNSFRNVARPINPGRVAGCHHQLVGRDLQIRAAVEKGGVE
jgi:hypothetical protein